MKTLAILLLLAAPMLAHATDVHPGDSLDDVQSALGMPNGHAQIDNNLTLFYDRGQVQLVDGKVTRLDLLSPEAFAAQQAQQKADDARNAQLRAQNTAEGQALKAQKLSDPAFAAESPADQLSFWQTFSLRYPEVPSADAYNIALARQQEQLAAQERDREVTAQQQEIAAQQQRIADQQQAIAMQQQEVVAQQQELADQQQQVTDQQQSTQYPITVGYPILYTGFFRNDDRAAMENANRRRAEHAEPADNDRDDRPSQTSARVTPPIFNGNVARNQPREHEDNNRDNRPAQTNAQIASSSFNSSPSSVKPGVREHATNDPSPRANTLATSPSFVSRPQALTFNLPAGRFPNPPVQ
jgi:hypothetical protein